MGKDVGWQDSVIGPIRIIDKKQVPNGKKGFVIITKWASAFGQTIYMKEFYPFNEKRQSHEKRGQSSATENKNDTDISKQIVNKQKHFLLDKGEVEQLLRVPEFNKKISIGKVMNAICALLETDDSISAIAKKVGMEENMVKLLNEHIK